MADDFDAELKRVRIERARAAVRDVNRAGEALLGEAVRRAPLEEGTLRASASLALVVNGDRFEGAGAVAAASSAAATYARAGAPLSIDAEVSFNTVYAAAQHEGTEFTHPKGGEAKYLERPLGELAGRLESLIAAGQASIT